MDKTGDRLNNRLIPNFIRRSIDQNRVKKTIFNYYNQLPENSVSEEEKIALKYIRKNKLSVFPYPFQIKYNRKDIKVYTDDALNLKYILFDEKRLYFRRKSSIKEIIRNYNYLLIEQDINSPHRYLTDEFKPGSDEIFVDVGAAEGNLTLLVIEKVSKAYLFETDEDWIEALRATFAPWKDKVEIINKFVSNKDDEKHISLDQFFRDKEQVDFVKIDAEGAEAEILAGCGTILSSGRQLKIAICCYHKPYDAVEFNEFFRTRGFSVSFSDGFMIFNEPGSFSPPYLRRGVLRAEKTDVLRNVM